MKTKQELLKMLYTTLAELQSGTLKGEMKSRQQVRLELLYDIWVRKYQNHTGNR